MDDRDELTWQCAQLIVDVSDELLTNGEPAWHPIRTDVAASVAQRDRAAFETALEAATSLEGPFFDAGNAGVAYYTAALVAVQASLNGGSATALGTACRDVLKLTGRRRSVAGALIADGMTTSDAFAAQTLIDAGTMSFAVHQHHDTFVLMTARNDQR